MSGASANPSKTKRTRRRRTLNIEATLERYEARISRLPRSLLMELDGAYLSTYDVYSTVTHTDRGRICRGGKDEIVALRLMRVARSLGVDVRGVTSERQSDGAYICHELADGETRDSATVVYVGPYNYFTGRRASVWSLSAEDRVYCDPSASPPPWR